jgi:RNA polymerase sigma-54 factor
MFKKSILDKDILSNDSFSMQLQRPAMIQSQRLNMNPRLFQSLKMMELPVVDLREKIAEELERNPALEILEDRGFPGESVSADAGTNPKKDEKRLFERSPVLRVPGKGSQKASDEWQRFIEGELSQSETLQDHLLWQLRLEPIDENLFRI